jgi:hypothetical protein
MNERIARRGLILIAVLGLAAGLVAYTRGESVLAHWIWGGATVPVTLGNAPCNEQVSQLGLSLAPAAASRELGQFCDPSLSNSETLSRLRAIGRREAHNVQAP